MISGFSAESSAPVQDTSCVDRPSALSVMNECRGLGGAMSLGVSYGIGGVMLHRGFGGKDTLQTSPAHLATSQPGVGTQSAPVGYPGVEVVSRATYISRKKHNRETS